MFHVTTTNLSPDLRSAQPDLGTRTIGMLDAPALIALLEALRAIDPVQNHDAEPQVLIEHGEHKAVVRTNHGRLLLYDARDPQIPFMELDSAGIVQELSGAVTGPAKTAEPAELVSGTRGRRRVWIAAILVGAIALDGFSVRSAFHTPKVGQRPRFEAITDAREATAAQLSARGRYATGREPGDRVIEVLAGGRVRFLRIVASGEKFESEDAFQLGRIDGKLCLVSAHAGVIEIGNIDTLSYYRDVYRRL